MKYRFWQIGLIVLAGFLLHGCVVFEKKNQSGAAVEVNGKYLYRSTLDSLTIGLSSEDSIRVVQQYTSQWAKDMLVYDKSQELRASERKDLDALVADYRRSLYAHAYEEYLIDRRMPKGVPDSTIAQVYEQMPDRFVLDESIVKGMLVVVPVDAKGIKKLRGWMDKGMLDEIEKYAYANASGYELFTSTWLTTTQLLTQIPIDRVELENELKKKNQIEVNDSVKSYILQVSKKCLQGERMPMEYARPDIEKIVLSARQVDFLQQERERLYNEAIQSGEVKFYE